MHRFADAQLDVLGRNLALLAAAIILLQWLVRGRPPLPAWHWLILGLIVLAAVGLIALRAWAARAGYARFTPQLRAKSPAPLAMAPDDKEAAFATGRFEVEAKAGYLANLTAYWRTFGSREHAVMAIQHPSRFLLGTLPGEHVGMWYAFFKPEEVVDVAAGTVAFGATRRPGLRIFYSASTPFGGQEAQEARARSAAPRIRDGDRARPGVGRPAGRLRPDRQGSVQGDGRARRDGNP